MPIYINTIFFFFSFCSQTKMVPKTVLITLHFTFKEEDHLAYLGPAPQMH